MDEQQEEALDSIRYHVWSGLYNAEEVFGIVDEDVFGSDMENNGWLHRAIRREFGRKRTAEREWPEVTDCDRLDRAFETMRGLEILARHRCGLTQQDGLEVVESLHEEASGEDLSLAGYCFYTLQDMEGAMWGERGLWLAFGSFSKTNEDGERIGGWIRDEFMRSGFEVSWDGTINSRILLAGFRWRRRGQSKNPIQ